MIKTLFPVMGLRAFLVYIRKGKMFHFVEFNGPYFKSVVLLISHNDRKLTSLVVQGLTVIVTRKRIETGKPDIEAFPFLIISELDRCPSFLNKTGLLA
jgi:hypothetical protein